MGARTGGHRLERQHRRRGGARRAVELSEADPRSSGHLTVAGLAAQLPHGSWICRNPEAPIGSPLAISPPSVLTGMAPCISVAPSASSFSCSPSAQNPHSAMWMISAPASVSHRCHLLFAQAAHRSSAVRLGADVLALIL
jgi:hypothetical protein